MNRTIKFRAWDKQNNKMISWDQILHNTAYNLYGGLWELFKRPDTHIPMQYTGLKDTNGNEIYEGDIVDLVIIEKYNKGFTKSGLREVHFNNEAAQFQYKGFIVMDWTAIQKTEIVGNIYEHSLTPIDNIAI